MSEGKDKKTKMQKEFNIAMYFAIYFGLPFQRRNQLGFRKLDVVAEYINMCLCLMVVHSIFSPYKLHLRQKEIYDDITFLFQEDNRIIMIKQELSNCSLSE